MFHIVVIAHGTHEAIAQARLADADLSLVLFCARQSDHRDVNAFSIVTLSRHVWYSMIRLQQLSK